MVSRLWFYELYEVITVQLGERERERERETETETERERPHYTSARETTNFYKRLASKLSEKWDQPRA